ncbi:MAG: hypothetical protein U0531_10405 [Dehalococcoidia bacterium]
MKTDVPKKDAAMRRVISGVLIPAVALAMVALVSAVAPARADETRTVGALRVTASFLTTPVHPNQLNAVVLRVTATDGRPVTGLEQTLRLRIGVANQVTETRDLAPAPDAPGVYHVQVLLPKAAPYTLHLFGTAGDQAISEKFITGQNGLDKVVVEERQYPRGAGYVVILTFGAYLVGLAVLLGWAGLRRLRARRLSPSR